MIAKLLCSNKIAKYGKKTSKYLGYFVWNDFVTCWFFVWNLTVQTFKVIYVWFLVTSCILNTTPFHRLSPPQISPHVRFHILQQAPPLEEAPLRSREMMIITWYWNKPLWSKRNQQCMENYSSKRIEIFYFRVNRVTSRPWEPQKALKSWKWGKWPWKP